MIVTLRCSWVSDRRRRNAYRRRCSGHVAKSAKGPFRVLREFPVAEDAGLEVGQDVRVADVFQAGDVVDVTGISKGKGTAGVMKRHHFSGFPGSHGTHEYFRHGGSIGNRSYPGRVFKGKRMSGRYGATSA